MMKSPLAILLISLLFLAFTAKPLLGDLDQPLIDSDGDKVLVGADYYIMSPIWGPGGGGLTMWPGRNKICPADVVRSRLETVRGIPVTFSPVNNLDGVVYGTSSLNIKFTTKSLFCNRPTVWKVDNYDASRGKWFITTGGVEGNYGPETLLDWFYLQKVGVSGERHVYKLVYCPGEYISLCSDVGIYDDEGVQRLALSEEFFDFILVKAENLRGSQLV